MSPGWRSWRRSWLWARAEEEKKVSQLTKGQSILKKQTRLSEVTPPIPEETIPDGNPDDTPDRKPEATPNTPTSDRDKKKKGETFFPRPTKETENEFNSCELFGRAIETIFQIDKEAVIIPWKIESKVKMDYDTVKQMRTLMNSIYGSSNKGKCYKRQSNTRTCSRTCIQGNKIETKLK